jgi:hypothetical protein
MPILRLDRQHGDHLRGCYENTPDTSILSDLGAMRVWVLPWDSALRRAGEEERPDYRPGSNRAATGKRAGGIWALNRSDRQRLSISTNGPNLRGLPRAVRWRNA